MLARKWVRVVLVAALCGAAAADTPEDRAVAWNDRGLALAEDGRHEEAVRAFASALEEQPGNDTIRRNLARARALWGVALLEKGDVVAAEIEMRAAREVLPEDANVRLNLAACLDERGFPARAAVEVRKAVELEPGSALAHERLGNVHQREGRFEDAVEAWTKALRLDPRNAALAARVKQARTALESERNLTRQSSAHFEILFDMQRDAVLASHVLRALEEAHGVVAADLQRHGLERLRVVLLPTADFQAVTGAHAWVGGLYDGQIRLPVNGASDRTEELLARARHEYVHSVLAPLGRRAPPWLHEGLAQVHEGRPVAPALRRLRAASPLALDDLAARSFAATKDEAKARVQYDTALAFVSWLRTGERTSAFRAAMASLFADATLEGAYQEAYGRSLAELYEAFGTTVPR